MSKPLVEESKRIAIATILARHEERKPGTPIPESVAIGVGSGLCRLAITSTPQKLGGVRHWFRCSCGRRSGLLYLKGTEMVCRVCAGLAYRSQRLPRANKISATVHTISAELH